MPVHLHVCLPAYSTPCLLASLSVSPPARLPAHLRISLSHAQHPRPHQPAACLLLTPWRRWGHCARRTQTWWTAGSGTMYQRCPGSRCAPPVQAAQGFHHLDERPQLSSAVSIHICFCSFSVQAASKNVCSWELWLLHCRSWNKSWPVYRAVAGLDQASGTRPVIQTNEGWDALVGTSPTLDGVRRWDRTLHWILLLI